MGIKGLWTSLLKDYQNSLFNFVEDIPHGSATLLIDGNSFLFHLLNRQVLTLYQRYTIPREYGGACYRLMEEMIRLEIQRLRQKLGFKKLIFYFDGPTSYLKEDTKEKRKRQILEQWNLVYEITIGQLKSSMVKPEQLPLPPFAHQVMKQVLGEMKIQVVTSPDEADHLMAMDCQRMNAAQADEKTIAYCYSTDSDFLLMKDVPLIAIGSLDDETALNLSSGQKAANVSRLSIAVVVWRRENLAALYNCTEEDLIYWGLLMGNDYTGGFPHKAFHPSLKAKHYSSKELLEWLKENSQEKEEEEKKAGTSTRWNMNQITNQKLLLACRYSYQLYELQDVSEFCTEENRTPHHVGLELGGEIDDGVLLQPHHREKVKEWMNSYFSEGGGLETTQESSLAEITLKFLSDCLGEKIDGDVRSITKPDELVESTDLSTIFTNQHLNIFHQMIQQLNDPSANSLRVSFSLLSKATSLRIQWENVLAGNYFQLLVKDIEKSFQRFRKEENAKNGKMMLVSFRPSKVFDGILFHFLLQEEQLKQSSSAAGVVASTTAATAAATAAAIPQLPQPAVKANDILPIDEYRDEILSRIERSRVVVLSGETGCGKSTRVPSFIYEDAIQNKKKCRIIICQPRRIACVNLKIRLQEKFGDKIGLRMGHGVREETSNTQIFFVTSGYLVRLIAHHPEALQSLTHLIIDEVHERSVDSDLLCYLVRSNLSLLPKLHVILMSATVQTALYQNYFNSTPHTNIIVEDTISVGVRRFPVETFYVEMLPIGGRFQKALDGIKENCEAALDLFAQKGLLTVPLQMSKWQYDICVNLVHKIGKVGTGILIFVSGMSDILELQSRFEGTPFYKLVAIHSEIPFEEQLEALQPPTMEEIKIIIATNAAESSVTLPNVDVVICFGTHKAVNVNVSKGIKSEKKKDVERSILSNVWISQSSAIQRAGRTGRIRPGKVYRLYTKNLFEKVFPPHDDAEIHRKPLYEVIITLKSIFENDPAAFKQNALIAKITTMRDILQNLIETVPAEKIDAALSFLYYQQMITSPEDTAMSKLTSFGIFAGQSSVDLTLSKFMIYGITLGIGLEAIIIAAALSQPKTIFRIAHPSIHKDPDEYNAIVQQTFLGSLILDDRSYSDGLMMLRLFILWQHLSYEERKIFMNKYGIVSARIGHFISTVNHLVRRSQEGNPALQKELNLEKLLNRYYDASASSFSKENASSNIEEVEADEIIAIANDHGKRKERNYSHRTKPISSSSSLKANEVTLENYIKNVRIPDDVIQKIRLILLWSFHHNLLVSKPPKESDGPLQISEASTIEFSQSTLPITDFMKYFPSSEETTIKLTGKYHYEFYLKTPTASFTSSAFAYASFIALVQKIMRSWKNSQLETLIESEVKTTTTPAPAAASKTDSTKRRDRKGGKNEKEGKETAGKEEIKAPLAPQMDNFNDLHHITVISMKDDPKSNNNNSSSSSSQKKKKPAPTELIFNVSIAVFMNFQDLKQAIRSKELLVRLVQLLQPFQPEYRSESIFLRSPEEGGDDAEEKPDAQFAYFTITNISNASTKMDELYKCLLEYSGILQTFSVRGGGGGGNKSQPASQVRVVAVNWKPSRSFFITYLSQIDSATVWAEDSTFHQSYDHAKEENINYKVTFPKSLFKSSSPSSSTSFSSDEKETTCEFQDISDYVRLFNAYASGQREKKMKVTISASNDPGEEKNKLIALVPGSELWKRQKEIERQQEENIALAKPSTSLEIKTIPNKARITGWKIVSELHSIEEERDTDEMNSESGKGKEEEDEEKLIDLSQVTWRSAFLSSRSPTGTSFLSTQPTEGDGRNTKLPIYGIAYESIITVSAASGQENIFCEGVTLFPSIEWTKWGLLCVGVLLQYDSGKETKKKEKKGTKKTKKSKATKEEEDEEEKNTIICHLIHQQLNNLKNYRIEEKPEFIDLLSQLWE